MSYCKLSSIAIGGTYVNTILVTNGTYTDNVSLSVLGKTYTTSDTRVFCFFASSPFS